MHNMIVTPLGSERLYACRIGLINAYPVGNRDRGEQVQLSKYARSSDLGGLDEQRGIASHTFTLYGLYAACCSSDILI